MKKTQLFAAILIAAQVARLHAAGSSAIGNEMLSARVMGQGGVGVAARNNDPSVVYQNPAGLTRLNTTSLSLGTAWAELHGRYESAGGGSRMHPNSVFVPNLSVSRPLNSHWSAGLSVQSPFGLETHWPGDGPLRYVATGSKLKLVDITPAVGYALTPRISIGAGIDYFYALDAEMERRVSVDAINAHPDVVGVFGPTPPGAPDGHSRFSSIGRNWGYHAGLLLDITEKQSFGIAYHSAVRIRLKGTTALSGLTGPAAVIFGGSDYETSAYADIVLPASVQVGYAFEPGERWMLEVDGGWSDWSAERDVNVRFAESDANRRALLNTGNPAKTDRRNGWALAAGANYRRNEKLQWRGGFFYLPYATPEPTFTPSVMDLSRLGLCAGAGWTLSPAWTLDISYTALFYRTRRVHNKVGAEASGIPAYDVSGAYKNFANAVLLNFTYRVK